MNDNEIITALLAIHANADDIIAYIDDACDDPAIIEILDNASIPLTDSRCDDIIAMLP